MPQIHSDIKRNLVVAASARVQALAHITDARDKDCLYIHMYIFGVNFKFNLSVFDIIFYFAESFYNQLGIGFGYDALSAKHFGVCHTTLDILRIHSCVKADRGIKIVYKCICGL